MLVVDHAFCLSEAGSAQSHLLAACEGISLVIVCTCFIVGMLPNIYVFYIYFKLDDIRCVASQLIMHLRKYLEFIYLH